VISSTTNLYLVRQNYNKIQVTKDNRPYQALGGALKAWRSGNREVLLSGPAGTGKSRACLQKLHFCAQKYPGIRIIICRKTRKSITQTAMVTFEQKVLPRGWLDKYVHFSTVDQQYEYANGSVIAVGGLDDPLKIMSSEWDLIYVQEATELREDDWEMLTTRLRNGMMPYQQLLADCNPSAPSHWLKKRADRKATQMIESRHRDNPSVTPEYMATLNALTGVRKKRLRDGIWAAAEGMVYQDEWDPDVHLMDRFDIPREWTRFWTVDFGFRNPFVWQAWAEGPDGELYRYLEIYKTESLVEDLAKQIRELTANDPRPRAIICDHDAEDRATFERHAKCKTIAADKAVSPGIQSAQSRLRVKKNGRPSIFFLRDSLVGIDHALADKNLPYCTDQEFESYVWDVENGKKIKEEPVKQFDHGMDAMRYLCVYKDGHATSASNAMRELAERKAARAKRFEQKTA